MKKNVLFLVGGLGVGGTETYLLRFIDYLQKFKFKCYVWCKLGTYGPLLNQYQSLGVILVNMKLGKIPSLNYIKFYKYLKINKIDAVVDFTGNFSAFPLYIAFLANVNNRIPFYRTSRNRFNPSFIKNKYNDFLNLLVRKYSTRILLNSKAGASFFFPNQMSKINILYNGADAELFISTKDDLRSEFSIPQDAFVFGHVGRNNSAKNHETMISIANIFCEKHKDVYFVFCGNNVPELSSYVKPKFKTKILLFDSRSDIIKVLNTINCFVFLSTTEGQPNALIEAMIVGKNIVASNIDAIKEVVPPLYHNYLVDPLCIPNIIEKLTYQYNSNKTHWYNDKSHYLTFVDKFSGEKRFNDLLGYIMEY